MIGYDELKELTARAGELYPPHDDAGEREWWAHRGVDADGLHRFCAEDAADSATNTLAMVGEMHDTSRDVLIAGGFAMSEHVGFMLGWIACEKARA